MRGLGADVAIDYRATRFEDDAAAQGVEPVFNTLQEWTLMLDSEFKVNMMLIGYGRMLTGDIPDERMAEQPIPGVNHPAWIIGHLAYSADAVRGLLGLAKELPQEWAPLFGMGSKMSTNRADYPSREELLRAFEQGFAEVREAAMAATAEQLAKPSQNPRMREMLPTVQDGVAFLLTGHLGTHLGQLSAWRRMIGMPALF